MTNALFYFASESLTCLFSSIAIWLILHLGRVEMQCTGLEKLEGLPPFLMAANRRSNFDPFIAIAACPQVDLAYIAKPEIFNIPIVGRIVHQCFFLPINRTDNREALGTIKYAAKLLFRDITEIDDYGAFFHSLQDDDRVVIAGGDGMLNRFINDTAPLQIDCIIMYSFLTRETAALSQIVTQTRKGFG